MNTLHTLLARQVKRQFGTLESLPAECRAFVREVDEAYREMEDDRGMLERALDISSEEQMQANAQMRALLDAFPDLFFRLDAQGRILEHKAGFAEGASPKTHNLVGKLIQAVPQPEAAHEFQAAIEQVNRTRSLAAFEYSMKAQGAAEYYEARLVPLPKEEIFVIVRNITERKRAEKALLEMEEQLTATLNALPDLLFAIDRAGRIIDYRAPSLENLYLPPEQFLGRPLRDVLPPETIAVVMPSISEAFIKGTSTGATYSLRIGEAWKWYELTAARQGSADAKDARVIVLTRDITKRKQAEECLRRSEERLRLALTASNQGLYDLNVQTGEAVVSREYAMMLGYDPATFHETNEQWRARLHPEDQEQVYRAYTDYVSGQRPDYRVEFRQRTQGGEWKWILSVGKIVDKDAEGRALRMLGTHTDITYRKQIEDMLRRSVERLDFAMEAANDGLWDLHVPDRHFHFSPRYYTMLGYEPEALPASQETWLELIHPDDRDSIRRKFENYLQDSVQNYEAEFRMRHQSGSYLWILSRGKVVERNAQGQPIRMVGTHSDITARKLAEEKVLKAYDELETKVEERTLELTQANASLRDSEDRVRSILESVQAGIIVVDPTSREVLDANPAALSLLQRGREEVVGRICHNSICPAERGRCPVADLGQTVDNSERVLLRNDGTRVPILKTVIPITLGGRRVLLESFIDITERKRAQDELERAKAAAEAASLAKSRFLAMMSHEIRTPLNGVTGVLHLLQKESLSTQQHHWIEMASTSAGTLMRVINDILDFSKVEAGKLDLHIVTTDLHAVVSKTAAAFTERAVAKGLGWHVFINPEVPRYVATDGDRLAQVLGNLLGNAVKFTETGTVNLRVTRLAEAADHARVRFEVADTGDGLSPEQQERLFKPFSQVDNSSTRRHGGTGLGLGICKHLVKLMGGNIGVQSAVGKGSTFWFELPLKKTTSRQKQQAAESSPVTLPAPASVCVPLLQHTPKRVLLAEDNDINQELAREMIQFAGCECECVVNGAQAVRAAASGRFDLMFMDCMMPGMDGYTATQSIRAEEAKQAATSQTGRRLPIIAMTANAMEGDREECLAAGMDDYLSKPLDPEEVQRMLQRWLTNGHQDALAAKNGSPSCALGSGVSALVKEQAG